MKKFYINYIIPIIMLALIAISCNKNNDEPILPDQKVVMNNSALLNVLKAKGFTVEGNQFVINQKARKTTTLDLSGSNLSDISGLEVFPNLQEINLSNNAFDKRFDFATLPENITSVNLSDNEIYEFKGLVNVDIDDAKVTVLRKLDKLILPYSARYNVEALPFCMKEGGVADMQIQNKQGKLEKYTTLRDVPDDYLRKYLKRVFKKKFVGNKLDIGKNFSLESRGAKVNISTVGGFWGEPSLANVKYSSLEGIQYIVNDPRFEGELWGWGSPGDRFSIEGYLKPGKKFKGFYLINISTPYLDMSDAESVTIFGMVSNKGLTDVDLSASKRMMQRGEKSFPGWFQGDMIWIIDCPQLETFKLPDVSNTPDPVAIYGIAIVKTPKLKSTIDMSKLQVVQGLSLAGIPNVPEIKYPEKILYYLSNGEKVKQGEKGKIQYDIDEATYQRASTKAFIKKHYDRLKTEASDPYFQYFVDGDEKPIKEFKKYDYKKKQ